MDPKVHKTPTSECLRLGEERGSRNGRDKEDGDEAQQHEPLRVSWLSLVCHHRETILEPLIHPSVH
jgi:hypothetical protein